ncbi:MAG TPA: methionyl-tRNA formyltransferase [Pirellulales bacterium]
MRIVVLGTGPFAVPMFQSLLDSTHDLRALITRPVPPAKGRTAGAINPMRDAALARGLPVHEPPSINSDEGKRLMEQLAPELLVVCDYGQILTGDVLGLGPLGGINLHASVLPKYRGAAPIQWALLQGETETGVSVIHMTPRLDGGPILIQRKTAIGPEETHPQLEARLALLGIEAVHAAIDQLAAWDGTSPIGTAQDVSQATKAPRLKKEQGAIDWSRSAEQIRNQVRALQPWPGSYTFWQRPGQEPLRLSLEEANVMPRPPGAAPGTVVSGNRNELVVATGGGGLSIKALQPASKRVMSIAEFLRGYPVREGDRFAASPPD